MADNAPLSQSIGPAGGGAPAWGLNDAGQASDEALLFASDPWDTFYLGAHQLPGECKLIAGGVARIEVNKKKGKGTDGARITLVGYDPQEFQVECHIVPSQFGYIQDVIDIYWRNPGKTSNLSQVAISVYHPGLAPLKIYSAVLIGWSPFVDGKIEGTKMTTLRFIENVGPTKKNVTKSATAAPAQDPRKPNSSLLANGSPEPPSSSPANLSTSGPSQFMTPAGAE